MKTAMSDANLTKDELVEAIVRGGVALQEVLSSQLVAEGQMLRRERSFEGVEVNYITLDNKEQEHKAIADNITDILREIIAFQTNHVDKQVEELDKIAVAEGKEVSLRQGTSQAGVDNQPYFSKVFNVINQMLFSIKAEAVAERAIVRLKEGKKPVIAFASTMGSFIDKGLNFVGVDPSDKMLKEAQLRNPKINWLLGTAEQIPTIDKTFGGAIATLTVHHWRNIKQSVKEIYRVLEYNGKLVLFTSTPEQMKGYWLNHYFPKMLDSSIIQMPSFDIIKDAATNAGFEITATEKYFIQDDLQDHFLYVGKNKPELYFNEKIRNGISSFSALANIEEVKQGLSKLYSDIENEIFADIKKQYDNDLGDYLFIIAEKKGSK